MLSDTPLLCARKLQTEIAGYLSCDFALYRKEISGLTVVLLTPNLSLVFSPYEFNIDEKIVVTLRDPTGQYCFNAEPL